MEENIKLLESLSNNIEKTINEFKIIYEKINENMEELKLKIQKIFTNIRNKLNEKEDELLLEVDNKYNNLFFKEDIIKKSEALPNKIKLSLEKGKIINNEWNDENKLYSLINDCINIEKNINDINMINENILKYNRYIELKIDFSTEENNEIINELLNNINKFGKIYYNNFKFKKCPINVSEDKKFIIDDEIGNSVTKIGKDENMIGIICENELKKDKVYKWKIRILKTKSYEINIGVAPIDFDYNLSKSFKNGWYFYCHNSKLYSGPPHNYHGKETNIKKPEKEITIVMDMIKKTLKFIIDGEDKGDSYIDIPIDKPITPSVTLYNLNDSVEIIGY